MTKFNFSKKTILVLLAGVLFLSFSFKSKFFEVAKQIEIYNTLFKELNMYYVNEINPAELTNKAIKNTLKDLDPYTNFYTEQGVEDARIRREGVSDKHRTHKQRAIPRIAQGTWIVCFYSFQEANDLLT